MHFHLVGIGGAGMSAIARVLLGRGFVVSGSDQKLNELTAVLQSQGATIYQGHRAEQIAGADGQSYRFLEPSFEDAGAAKGEKMIQVGIKDLNSLVAGVADVDAAVVVYHDVARAVELGGRRQDGTSRLAKGADLRQELAIRGKDLNPVVPGVGDVNFAVRPDGDAPWLAELTVVLGQ